MKQELGGRDVCGCDVGALEMGEEERGCWNASATAEIENSKFGLVISTETCE